MCWTSAPFFVFPSIPFPSLSCFGRSRRAWPCLVGKCSVRRTPTPLSHTPALVTACVRDLYLHVTQLTTSRKQASTGSSRNSRQQLLCRGHVSCFVLSKLNENCWSDLPSWLARPMLNGSWFPDKTKSDSSTPSSCRRYCTGRVKTAKVQARLID